MFNREELKSLDLITEELTRRSGYPISKSFEELMKQLYHLLTEVEEGYTMTIDDYTNELTRRDLAEKLLNEISRDLKRKVSKLLEVWDKRFGEATDVINEPLFDHPQWWWYRIPKKLVGDFKEDVESLNIK